MTFFAARMRMFAARRFQLGMIAVLATWFGVPPDCGISVAVAQTRAEPSLRISKSRLKLNPAVIRGYAAFVAGDLAAAEREYAQALKSEPGNPDALHGAAAVALRKSERERAEEFFRAAIAANPQDAIANAGLAGLTGSADPIVAESRLKSLIAGQPDQPSLHFALGNVYAASGRWRDAQQAYFSAHVGNPDQPDYLFNLAVSLDHLHQTKLARGFYEKALSATGRHPAGFDPSQAAARLRQLTP